MAYGTTTRVSKSSPQYQFACKCVYLWVWAVAQKLKTNDQHAILNASVESSVKLRLRDVRLALQIGKPSFELPPIKSIWTALVGKGDPADAINRLVTAASHNEELLAAVHHCLGDEEADDSPRDERIEPPRVDDPEAGGYEAEVVEQIDRAVYLAGRYPDIQDAPDLLTNPNAPPTEVDVLEILTIDLVHGYYQAKRNKDPINKLRHAQLIIKAQTARFAIRRLGELGSDGGEIVGNGGYAPLPPVQMASGK